MYLNNNFTIFSYNSKNIVKFLEAYENHIDAAQLIQ